MRVTTVSLLLIFFFYLTTLNFVRTLPLNNSDDAVVEMPLVTNNLKAPLVADLDVSALNKQLKHYIDTAISKTFTGKVKDIVEHSQDELKTTMLNTYKERLHESKAVYEENLAHLVGGFKSRFKSLFSELTENVTDLIDNLEEWKKGYTQTISEKYRPINLPRDCTDIKENNTKSGVYTIYIDNGNGKQVYCDMDVDEGGWIVIQKRSERKVKFERIWNEYENGFGEVAGEHWLGNKYIHRLTNTGKFELRVNMETKKGNDIYAVHKVFKLGDAASQYQLTVNGYSGTAEKYRPIDVPRDCTDIKENNMKSGVYTIFLADNVNGIKVYCDMDVDGGGWIVIQRRSERKVKFERTWNEYENGFGEVAGEHWLGNKCIHSLTNNGKFELRLNMETKAGEDIYALYKSFILGDAASQYQLTVNDYSGTAGDALQRQSSGKFSAIDRDNSGGHNHAISNGPWWYKGGSNTWLNDDQRENYWGKHRYIGRKTTMMIRRL